MPARKEEPPATVCPMGQLDVLSTLRQRGGRSLSPSLAAVFRPFSLRQIYSLVPKVTARFVETDIRVVEAADSSAVLQWYSNKQQEGLSPELRTEWLEMSCPAFCGAYSSIPGRMEPTAEPA